jgi:hypothetical protein
MFLLFVSGVAKAMKKMMEEQLKSKPQIKKDNK